MTQECIGSISANRLGSDRGLYWVSVIGCEAERNIAKERDHSHLNRPLAYDVCLWQQLREHAQMTASLVLDQRSSKICR